jgi:tetratricopeptide (TPR) repeat protein
VSGEAVVLRMVRLCVRTAAMLICLAVGVRAQGAGGHLAGHSIGEREEVAPEKLPPPQKLDGIGNVHLKISASPEAQMWFDQGLNLLHDFWDYESSRAFEQAVRADANCAMCYWGLYQAAAFRGGSRFYARQALAKAVELKGHASKPERLYIEAGEAHEAALKEAKDASKADFSKELQILRKLAKRSPKDTQARIFLAWALTDGYDDDGSPRPGQKEAIDIFQAVLKEEPDNSAANHYWIHVVEASPKPEQALHSSEILGNLAPASGHMVHMPGHIYYRVGDYASAEKSFAASTNADERYMQAQHVPVDDDWNYVHNLMYAIANLLEEGKLKEASTLSVKLASARGELSNSLYPWSPRDSTARLEGRLPVALRQGDWAKVLEMLKASEPGEMLPNLVFLRHGLREFATGMQAVEAGDLKEAEESSERLDAELWRTSERLKDEDAEKPKEKKEKEESAPKLKLMPDAYGKPLVSILSIMSLELRGGLLVARKDFEAAKKLYAQAAREEKALGYREPPYYVRPVAESEAAALMAAGQWADAKEAYKAALKERPRSGFPLYGIALSSERGGDTKTARTEYEDFVAAWKNADADLPQLAHARSFLAAHEAERSKSPAPRAGATNRVITVAEERRALRR